MCYSSPKIKLLGLIALTLVLAFSNALADVPNSEFFKLFPSKVATFRLVGTAHELKALQGEEALSLDPGFTGAEAEYRSSDGSQVLLELVRLKSDGDAYSLLTRVAAGTKDPGTTEIALADVGTASFRTPNQIVFFKGNTLARISVPGAGRKVLESTEEFARSIADQLDKGEADIPSLVKHLPENRPQKHTIFLPRFSSLQELEPKQEVLSAISTDGDADVVVSNYGSTRLMIIEFHTPQLAVENDQRIVEKIRELWRLGKPAPTGYRRVGNYSVLVFDAPDETSAKLLIDQVRYEQVVQWLGENPYILKEAQKRYAETTLGVFIAVVKASGYALIGCLGLGALFGGLLFSRRRAQQRSVDAFSDAGGMLRLNIDELTAQTDPARLLQDRN